MFLWEAGWGGVCSYLGYGAVGLETSCSRRARVFSALPEKLRLGFPFAFLLASRHSTLVRLCLLFTSCCQPLIGQRGVFHAKLFHSLPFFSPFSHPSFRPSLPPPPPPLFVFLSSLPYTSLFTASPPWFPATALSLIHMPPPLVQNLSH